MAEMFEDSIVLIDKKTGKRRSIMMATPAFLRIGGNGDEGGVFLMPAGATDLDTALKATVRVKGDTADLTLGGNGVDGDVFVYRAATPNTDPHTSTIHLRASDATVRVGINDVPGRILVAGGDGKASVVIDGNKGDIALGNADCAEEFELADGVVAEPGCVMVTDGHERLRPSTKAYDGGVVGVVAGAGSYRPGIVLGRVESPNPRAAVALLGRTYVKVDAGPAPIRAGDLLTTSSREGFAMKALDGSRAFGAVVGKALAAQPSGTGLIPMLVGLK